MSFKSPKRFIWQNDTQHFDSPSHDQAIKQLPTPPQQIRQRLPSSSSSSSQEARQIFLDNEENSSTYQTKNSSTPEIYEILTGNFQPPISTSNFNLLIININITATTPSQASFYHPTNARQENISIQSYLYTLHGS